MIYRLIILTGPRQNERVTVEETPMTIGRDPDCAIRVDDPEVARKHAAVAHTPDGLFIRDLGSMNRILVNKHEVRELRLKHNDLIELGRTRFLVQAVVQAEVSEIRASFRERSVALAKAAAAAVVVLAVVAGGAALVRKATRRPPAPPPAPAAVSPTPAQVSEELQHMREALTDIRESVRVLASRQAAAKTPPPPRPNVPPPSVTSATAAAVSPVDEALQRKKENLLKQAQEQSDAGNAAAADQLLASLQALAPDYLPAYEARAHLFEKRNMADRAIGQWLEVLQRSAGTASYDKAAAERTRLEQAARQQAAARVRKVKIASVEQYKFRESEDFDEMRILHIALAPESADQLPNAAAIRVQVSFFDADPASGAVTVTRALAPKDPLTPDGPWRKGEQKIVTATYVLPRGFRASEAKAGRSRQYYGYVVRVLYQGELQDTDARPKTLTSGAGGGSGSGAS